MFPSYVTGYGQLLRNVHDETGECVAYGCAIHNPTDVRRDWPTYWAGYAIGLVRVCPETGVFVTDRDEVNWRLRRAQREATLSGLRGHSVV